MEACTYNDPDVNKAPVKVVKNRNANKFKKFKLLGLDDKKQCPDGIHLCDIDSTCCPSNLNSLSDDTGNYGCCGLKNAVCCSDGINW